MNVQVRPISRPSGTGNAEGGNSRDIALVVFDCDGVILESMDVKTQAFRRIGAEFGEEAADRLALYHSLHGGVSRYEKFAWLYREVLGREISAEEKALLNEKFVNAALEEVTACPLVPGMQEVLDRLHGRLPMYVASGAPQEELCCILEKRGLARYFAGIRGWPPAKGALLKSIVEESGADPARCVMVGDAYADLEAARQAGTQFYGRGDLFKESGLPRHDDMTRFMDWLEGPAGGRR
ncbi:MAG: HAD family hydrolase [Desulfovibrio sp.]|jgi:HAD superfamily hydrolase (TIGR01549 family)|nr:HAD family hydrolase [Desulfovibrio sp.]